LCERGRIFPLPPGLLDIEEGVQAAMERWGSSGNQGRLKHLEQFLFGGAEAYGPTHVGHQPFPVCSPKGQEGNCHEFAHLG
jgi:hypothetical protein